MGSASRTRRGSSARHGATQIVLSVTGHGERRGRRAANRLADECGGAALLQSPVRQWKLAANFKKDRKRVSRVLPLRFDRFAPASSSRRTLPAPADPLASETTPLLDGSAPCSPTFPSITIIKTATSRSKVFILSLSLFRHTISSTLALSLAHSSPHDTNSIQLQFPRQ